MRILITLAMLLGLGAHAVAQPLRTGNIVVHEPWARALPPISRTGAAYLSIHNTGAHADRLVAADSPVSARVEMHTHEHAAGMMRMRQIDGVDLPAGQRVDFAPGGLHLMLIDLHRPLVAGEGFALNLTFAHAGKVQVQVEILADAPPAHGGHAGHGTRRH